MIALLAGGYARAGAGGLYPLGYDPAGGRLSAGVPDPALANVSAGLRVPGGDRWYFVDEAAGRIAAAERAPAGWTVRASVPSGGAAPCHLALDPDGSLLAVANYRSGTVALFRLDRAGGLPVEPPHVHRNIGRGLDPDRQAGPHAHWVGFHGGRLYAADLGCDRIFAFPVDAARAMLGGPAVAYAALPGTGPRQIAFHPTRPLAFLVSELASTLTVLRIDGDGRMAARQILSTLPAEAGPGSLGGAIAISRTGDRLFTTNRGHDSVAAFAVAGDGTVSPIGHCPSGGRSPRFLLLLEDEGRLLVAHETSGGVTALALDGDGRLHPTPARADVPGAAFLSRIGVSSA